MLERIEYDDKGILVTAGIEKYKIPTLGQVPKEFNVHLLKDAPGTRNVYSSKVPVHHIIHIYKQQYFIIIFEAARSCKRKI